MTKLQIEIFWDELTRIQKQYALFFPESQKHYISLQEKDGGHQLVFLEGYELPGAITLDIKVLYNIVQDLKFGREGLGHLEQ